jgi:hypothetical protein
LGNVAQISLNILSKIRQNDEFCFFYVTNAKKSDIYNRGQRSLVKNFKEVLVMKSSNGRRKKIWSKVLSMALTAALVVQMNTTAFAEEVIICDEPDWNEAGLEILGLIDEYADEPIFVAFLERFMERNMDELTGDMPNVSYEEITAPTIVTEIKTQWCDGNPALNVLSGIAPMSVDRVCVCCRRFLYSISGETNQNVRIVGLRDATAHTGTFTIPPTLTTDSGGRTVRTIDQYAFQGTFFSEVVIPATVSDIRVDAFPGLRFLTTVTFLGAAPPHVGNNSFRGTNNITRINVPFRAIARYWNGTPTTNVQELRRLDSLRPANVVICQTCEGRPCTCRHRLGDIRGATLNPGNRIEVQDALEILRHLTGQSSAIDNNPNARQAALITPESIRLGIIREADADAIIRFVTTNITNPPYILG